MQCSADGLLSASLSIRPNAGFSSSCSSNSMSARVLDASDQVRLIAVRTRPGSPSAASDSPSNALASARPRDPSIGRLAPGPLAATDAPQSCPMRRSMQSVAGDAHGGWWGACQSVSRAAGVRCEALTASRRPHPAMPAIPRALHDDSLCSVWVWACTHTSPTFPNATLHVGMRSFAGP